jgi:hypothetical protein
VAAVWSAALAALCGVVILLTTLVHSPTTVLLVLFVYSVVFVTGLGGIVLTAHAVRRFRRDHETDRRLVFAALMMLPSLLWAAYLSIGADSWAADVVLVAGLAGVAFALLSLLLYAVPVANRG